MLTVLKDNLATALALSSEAVSRDKNIPIRSFVHLNTSPGRLTLSTTDTVMAVVLDIGAKVEQPVNVTVSHAELKDFVEAVRTLPESHVALQLIGAKLRVTCGRVVQEFGTLPATDFPIIQPASAEAGVAFSASRLTSRFERWRISLSLTRSGAADLAGIRIKFKKAKNACGLSFTATDGNSAAIAAMPLSTLPDEWAGTALVLPAASLVKACKILKGEEMVAFGKPDSNRIQFTTPNITVTLAALEGSYPEVEKIMPRTGTVTAVFPVRDLLRHVKISLLVNFKFALQFNLGEPGHLQVEAIGEGLDPRTSSLSLDGAITGSLLIGANGLYIKKALEGLEELAVPNVQITLNAPTTPIGIQPIGADLNKPVAQFVFAPLRLGSMHPGAVAPEPIAA